MKKDYVSSKNLPSLLIRIGLAIVFAYAAISALLTPEAWIGYVPEFSTKFVQAKISLDILSLLQLVLVGWLIWGRYMRYAAIVSGLFLGGLVVANPEEFLITFRDIGLVFASGALYFLDQPAKSSKKR